jgi:hypothetical protein
MQKTFNLILFLFIYKISIGQNLINLSLKFKGQSPTVYKVTMNPENIDSVKISSPLFEDLSKDSSGKKNNQTSDMFRSILEKQKATDEYFVIKRINDNKYFLLLTDTFPARYLTLGSLNYSTFIDNKGNNLSFYLPNALKKMTHMFFRLPENKVKVGDSWKLGIDMTEIGNNATCDSSFKKDNVTLSDISIKNGDTLVTINYDFEEYFTGSFITQIRSDLKYYGKAIFSVDRGDWVSYDCIKESNMTGIVNSKSKEIYKLELVTDYPKQILKKVPY